MIFESKKVEIIEREISKKYRTLEKPNMSNIQNRIKRLPSTRFYGSKRRLIPWIYQNICDLNFYTVLDGFGGTASVSLLFKEMGKHVTYNDALKSNTISAKALLSNINPISDINEVRTFLNSIKPFNGIINKNFGGIFYTEQENRWLDGAIKSINALDSQKKRNAYLYCLFQACLKKRPFNLFHRANLYLRLNSNKKRTFGNLVTWNTPFVTSVLKTYSEFRRCIWDSGIMHKVLNPRNVCDVFSGFDLVYLDPPYISGNGRSDDYLQRYHFLEGIAKYDNWLNQIDYNSKCLWFFSNPYIRDWQTMSKFQNLLFDLIDYHKKSIVVLSYVYNAYPSIEDIIYHFKKSFNRTRIAFKETSQALSKNKRNEVLIIGLP